MLQVLIKTDSHYTVNRKRLRTTIARYLLEKKVKGEVEISVNIVGNRMMRSLNKTYRKIDQATDVLSFPLIDDGQPASFVPSPDRILRLGDIVISYPEMIQDAAEEEKLVDDKIDELILHAMDHLMGNHHE